MAPWRPILYVYGKMTNLRVILLTNEGKKCERRGATSSPGDEVRN